MEGEQKMITVEGYKAFRGAMIISPKNPEVQPFVIEGDWLFKPDTNCWYGQGCSFSADICEVVTDNT